MKRIAMFLSLFVGLFTALGSAQTFNFSFSGTGVSASGTMTTTLVSGNKYLVTSISGTQNSAAMTLLSPNGFEENDNDVYSTSPYADISGIAFSVGGQNYNVWYNSTGWNGFPNGYCEWGPSSDCTPVSFSLTTAPSLSLGVSPTTGTAPFSTTFNVTCSVCIGYIWNFGDASYASGPSLTQAHTYANPGTYIGTVYSVSASGVTFSATATVTVTAPQHAVNLNWNPESGVTGYNVYRGSTCGTYGTKLTPSLDTSTTFTDSTVVAGAGYCYVATAVNSAGESGYSNTAAVTIPTP